MQLFRSPSGNIHHLVRETNTTLTLCGRSTRVGYRFTPAQNVVDPFHRPTCKACRKVLG